MGSVRTTGAAAWGSEADSAGGSTPCGRTGWTTGVEGVDGCWTGGVLPPLEPPPLPTPPPFPLPPLPPPPPLPWPLPPPLPLPWPLPPLPPPLPLPWPLPPPLL